MQTRVALDPYGRLLRGRIEASYLPATEETYAATSARC